MSNLQNHRKCFYKVKGVRGPFQFPSHFGMFECKSKILAYTASFCTKFTPHKILVFHLLFSILGSPLQLLFVLFWTLLMPQYPEIMEAPTAKVHVAIGTDWYDGFSTLQWTLSQWSDQKISIVILHAANGVNKDYVMTPFGKLPTSSVSEEKLKALEKVEEAKSDKMLSEYVAYCGKVKAEVIKIEKNEQPLHNIIVEMISTLRITKLVMSLAFMKSPSSWKPRTAISGSFYVLHHKPNFCELFVIYEGRSVFLRGENDDWYIEDDRGAMVAKLKEKNRSIKNWLGKMFHENVVNSPSSSSGSNCSPNQWNKYGEEIEQYVNDLLCLHEHEGEINEQNGVLNEAYAEQCMPENVDGAERIQILGNRIKSAQGMVEFHKRQTNDAKEGQEKANWAISICNNRVEDLEVGINKEVLKNADLNKEVDIITEVINELKSEVDEKRSKLSSILQLQKELLKKLHLSSSAKVHAESQLDKEVRKRADMVQEIEELRKHRDVLQLRIEFCKEKDAIGEVSKLNGLGFYFREFSTTEIIAATEDFSEYLKLRVIGDLKSIYKGRINQTTVAIKMCGSENIQSSESFARKVKLLGQLKHPNLLAMIGFCSEPCCIVYEYMHNGSLHDALSLAQSCKRKCKSLGWHARIRIAAEICSALGFLHKAKPKPLAHGNLTASKILLDRNNIVKINGLDSHLSHDQPDARSDIRAFGDLLLQLLWGKNWSVQTEAAPAIGSLDSSAGDWPMDIAMELCGIALTCSADDGEHVMTAMPVSEINGVKKRADQIAAAGEKHVKDEEALDAEDSIIVPAAFLCPIYQDVMQNPYLAADGFSYELEAIEEWLKMGHDKSPATNLRLKHKLLTPNHTLKSLIQDWQNKRSASRAWG